MKIVFTGGGSGGHFYPIIAVIEKCIELVERDKIFDAKFYYFAPSPYNRKLLFENGIKYQNIPSGKMHRYFTFRAPIEYLKTGVGIIKAILSLWSVYPDAIFSKGGYGSFPTLFAAKLLRIPVILHESDSVPGRANLWAGKFAQRVALSYPEAASYFKKEKIAFTGQPVRKEILQPASRGAFEYLGLSESIPVILVMGGSQGAGVINETILDALPELVSRYQIIHQTGTSNADEVEGTAAVILEKNPFRSRYKIFGYLNDLAVRMSAGAAALIISRAGSTIFEIAAWGIPSIIVPITESNGDHQRKNAFSYARAGAAIVIEEKNLTPHILVAEIKRIMENKALQEEMRRGATAFFKKGAAEKIARETIRIALTHEK